MQENQLDSGVFLDLASADTGDLDLGVLERAVSHWSFHRETAADEVARRLSEADVVISNKVVLDEALLTAAPHLALVCVAATGTNNVDLAAARRLGITVCNVRDYATASVVQHVFALILALTTRLLEYRGSTLDGAWNKSAHFCRLDYPIRELAGRTLGIIGYGSLGQAVAGVAKAFGMQVIVAQSLVGNPVEDRVDMDTLLADADVVSLHTPLSDKTRGLVDVQFLARMRSDAILINTARGGMVDEQALADALRGGIIGGAGLDVLAEEPPATDCVLLDPDIPNLVVTPHIAWASVESRQRMIDEVALNIQAFIDGTPRNVVV